jgi:ribulose-phosphate 3-epimerase
LAEIHALGAGAGLSLNPPTPVRLIEPYLDQCDLVLVMSVMPGFGGQSFDEGALGKLRRLADVRESLLLSVDGGVNTETIGRCAQAGADVFVAGTAFFGHENYPQRLAELTNLARTAKDVPV